MQKAVMAKPICWLREGEVQVLWTTQSACPPNVVLFTTDDKAEFTYEAFNRGRDFGPLDLAATVRYCQWLDHLVRVHQQTTHKVLAHMTWDQPLECWSNTVTLCCAYLVLGKGLSAAAAIAPFAELPLPHFLDCRGAAAGIFEDTQEPDFRLRVIDVLTGLQHARDLGWLDYRTFNLQEYAALLRPERGDMTWLLKGKAVAMASPWARPYDTDNLRVLTPEDLVPYFQQNKVGVLIQCNNPEAEEQNQRRELLMYDPNRFQRLGIRHVWLPFEDGGCPTVDILQRFLSTCESHQATAFAVHCRSGLGRTATLIGAYAIRHCGFTARSFIGWSRVCRPGTVHGNQQQYLVNLEPYLRMGAPKALSSLNSAEQLRLLPKRELRFFALDRGISSDRTAQRSDEEVIEMILQARQAAVPVEHLRPPDPAVAQRAERAAVPAGNRTPVSPVVTPTSAGDGSSELWEEVLRYLRLLSRAPCWQPIVQLVEQLRDRAQKSGALRFQSRSSQDPAEADRLQRQQQAALQTSKEKEEELQSLLQQLHSVQRDCSQLRLNIAKGQGEVEAATTVAQREAEEKLRQLRVRRGQLQEERSQQQQNLQAARHQLNQPWESAKYSLDQLRSRLQVSE